MRCHYGGNLLCIDTQMSKICRCGCSAETAGWALTVHSRRSHAAARRNHLHIQALFRDIKLSVATFIPVLRERGCFCEKAGWRQQQLKMFRKEGGGTGDSLTDGKSSLICFSSCVLPVETLVSVRNSEPHVVPLSSFSRSALALGLRRVAPEWCWARGMHNQPLLNVRHRALFLTCTANMGWSYYLWGLAFGDGIYTGISVQLISVPAPTCTAEHLHSYFPCRGIFKLRFSQSYLRTVGSVT